MKTQADLPQPYKHIATFLIPVSHDSDLDAAADYCSCNISFRSSINAEAALREISLRLAWYISWQGTSGSIFSLFASLLINASWLGEIRLDRFLAIGSRGGTAGLLFPVRLDESFDPSSSR
jgi:hypothetical protein